MLVAAIPRDINFIRVRRSNLSAMAPARIPRKKFGAIRRPSPRPTMNGELVTSSSTQPNTTASPMDPMPLKSEHAQRYRMSLNWTTGP